MSLGRFIGGLAVWLVSVCLVGFAEGIAEALMGFHPTGWQGVPGFSAGVATTLISIWAFRL